MKGIYFDSKKASYREDLIKPIPRKDQSLIKIEIASICSTDKEILKGYRPDFKGIMGHEFVGIVEESLNKDLIGKRVVGEINEYCNECIYCRTNRKKHCINVKSPGISSDGCFSEYMALQTSLLHVIPDTLRSGVAVFTEPLAAAFEILEEIKIEKDTPVAILGDGRLALLIANVISLTGAKITTIGHHNEKLELFKKFGETSFLGEKEGYEIVIDATGKSDGLNEALSLVRKKGTIVMKSTYKGETNINFSLVPVNEIKIVGSRCGPFEPAIKALDLGKIILPKIEIFDLKDFNEAFNSNAFKAGFRLV